MQRILVFCKEGEDMGSVEGRIEEYLKEFQEDEKCFLVLPCRKNEIVLEEGEIHFIERDKRVTRIHTDQESVVTTMKISEVYEYLDHKKFVLCHNSFIVNLEKVRIFNRSEITLRNGQVIPISRSHWKGTKEIFDSWAGKYMKKSRRKNAGLKENTGEETCDGRERGKNNCP